MKFWIYILLFSAILSCANNTDRGGDIKLVPRKGGATEIVFYNSNTTALRDIGVFLSIDELCDINPVKIEFKVTAPNKEYWVDTLYFDSKQTGNKIDFSGRKEIYCKAYKNACMMQGGEYKFSTRIIDLKSDLIYMTGIIIENKDSGKR